MEGSPVTFRQRWLSPRALLLHLEVLVVAPGCVAAGWWQATRALAGNSLSWVYSIEWPIFALIALWVWWHLVHEDPEAYRARRASEPAPEVETSPSIAVTANVEADAGRWARFLAVGVGIEIVVGVMALVAVPVGRPAGWLPARGEAVYLVHAIVGIAVTAAAAAMVTRSAGWARIPRVMSWLGLVSLLVAGGGGLLTEGTSLVRFGGIAIMGIGACLAGLCYFVPAILHSKTSVATVDPAVPEEHAAVS